MSWAKLDDGHDDSRKARRACREGLYGLAALGLHVLAISQSARRETNGAVDLDWLDEKLRKLSARERERLMKLADDLGLFDTLPAGESRDLKPQRGPDVTVGPFADDHILVHDYLDYNDSSEYLKARRKADADRKANGGGRGGSAGSQEDSEGNPDGIRMESEGTTRVRPLAPARAQVGSGREEKNSNGSPPARGVDPDTVPDDFPPELQPALDHVLPVLQRIASARGADAVSRAAVARTMASLPRRPHVEAAHDLEHWLLHGTGREQKPKDVVGYWRNQLKRKVDQAGPISGGPRRTDVAGALDRAYGRTAR